MMLPSNVSIWWEERASLKVTEIGLELGEHEKGSEQGAMENFPEMNGEFGELYSRD